MARNSEKAMTMMNRWVTTKQTMMFGSKKRDRPAVASQVKDVPECQRYRGQVIKEFDRTYSKITNRNLPESTVRDLNDRLNKLLREKFWWEKQIVELGGPNFLPPSSSSSSSSESQPLAYKYFGAAKDLPGVKELFSKESSKVPRRTRQDLYRNISLAYYGFRDEEDLVLLLEESEKEMQDSSLTAPLSVDPVPLLEAAPV